MNRRRFSPHPGWILALLAGTSGAIAAWAAPMAATARVDFVREVQPILAENCYACHGFDPKTRLAGLRLDTFEGATTKLPTGNHAVVPGKPQASTLVSRVAARTMPPRNSGKELTDAQIDVLRRWVAQGGSYQRHWAFVSPKRPTPPRVSRPAWVVNPIDQFVLARLEREGLKPSPPADRTTLIRRLSFDLTGLPPTLAEVNAFLGDNRPGAYERLVDRLLASPHYGEKMALGWLDLARYADTHGYHIDSHRDMWPWRDWVIRTFNANLPYDQFIIQQLAGDLLPNPTLDQKIATGFNRNHPINFEGGAIPEEYHAAYIFDRIDTTSTAFMGLTMRCAQCHDHKYDPLSQRDFYKLYAYFHNIAEQGLDGTRGNAAPFIKAPTPEQQQRLAELSQAIRTQESQLSGYVAQAASRLADWERTAAASLGPSADLTEQLEAHFGLDETGGAVATGSSATGTVEARITGSASWAPGRFGNALSFDGNNYAEAPAVGDYDRSDAFSYGAWIYTGHNGDQTVMSRMDSGNASRGWDLYVLDRRVYAHLIHRWPDDALRLNTRAQFAPNTWTHVFVTYDGSGKAEGTRIYLNGKAAEVDVTHNSLKGTLRTGVPMALGRRTPGAPFRGLIDEVRLYRRALRPDEVERLAGLEGIRTILKTPAEERSPAQREALTRYFLETSDPEYRRLQSRLADTRKSHADLDAAIPTTMVMQELPQPRPTFILARGEYDKKGEQVKPGTPETLPALPADAPPNRMALARWLVDPNHPLTARVAVNRFWQAYFGAGLVRTPENFGTQGEPPTHPELLDWLATEFIRTGWDVKAMQRLIVTSATYRQSSRIPSGLRERDPDNRLLARGPRQRLKAEYIRDQALRVSGLLVPTVGGPSVKPYQPPGLWEELAFGGNFTAQTYEQDHGEKLYRRSMYTFWKRTCPPPALQTFDAPEREVCVVARSTTNTPLQALVLMNETAFVEASRKLAERVLTEIAATPRDRARYAFRLVLSRQPTARELDVLMELQAEAAQRYTRKPEDAEKLVKVGESPRNERIPAVTLAAWTDVCSVILNMDEAVTKN